LIEQPRHILVVSCLIRNESNQILLVKHRSRGWELPQGRVEEGESLIFALSREALEETGVTICHAKLEMIWSKVSAPSAVVFCFSAQYASGELTPSEETPCVEWCSEIEVTKRVTHPINRDRVQALLRANGCLTFHSYVTGPYRLLS
jgi:8-oxo-dGTP diphosphatase